MLRLNASVLAVHMRKLIAAIKVKSLIIAVNDVPLYISRRRGQRLPQLGLDGSQERTDKRLEPLRIIPIDDKMQRFSVRREGDQYAGRVLNWANPIGLSERHTAKIAQGFVNHAEVTEIDEV
jgi:hypothetical protein